MKYIYPILLISIFLCSACKPSIDSEVIGLQAELEKERATLRRVSAEYTKLKDAQNSALIHTVYLDLKETLTEEEKKTLFKELRELSKIEVLHNLQIGTFADLGDKRALSTYDLVFQMGFDNAKAYSTYQAHPIHQTLKSNIGKYLAGPPATHDFNTIK